MIDTKLETVKLHAVEKPVGHASATSFGLTDLGRRRKRNEDQYLIATLTHALCVTDSSIAQEAVQCGHPQSHLFVIADGVGGHAGGDQASALAVRTIESFVLDSLRWCSQLRGDGNTLLTEFQQALQKADSEVAYAVQDHPELRGMGTTVTLGYLVDDNLFVAHVGDSRCYIFREPNLYQLTHDHTLVAEMVRRGLIDQKEAATHNLRHMVVNVVGGKDTGVNVELHKIKVISGDKILFCSDGLTTMVGDAEIATLLQATNDPEEACHSLVNRANELGGHDNLTVIVVHFK